MKPEFKAMPLHNIDYLIAHARACGTYFYKLKFLRLKENSYLITIGQWITPQVTGDKLPNIASFTLTPIDDNSGTLFGGRTSDGPCNDVYRLTFTEQSVEVCYNLINQVNCVN